MVARYNLFSGGGCRPSLKGLGVWYRAYGRANAAEIETLVAGLRADHMPCDVLGLEPGGWKGERNVSVRYPPASELIDPSP